MLLDINEVWINETNKSRKQDPFSFTCHLRSVTSQSELVRKVEDNPAGCRALTVVSFGGKPQWYSPNRLSEIQPINITVWSCMEKATFQNPIVSNISPPPKLLQLILLRETCEFLTKNNYFSTRQTERNNFKEYMWNPNPLTSATKTTKAQPETGHLSHLDWPALEQQNSSVLNIWKDIFATSSVKDLSDKTVFSGF